MKKNNKKNAITENVAGKRVAGKRAIAWKMSRFAMTGLLAGSSEKKDRLVRFGYAQMTAEKDSLPLRRGETFPIHEFHYWDTTNNGTDCSAVKPVSGRSWQCAITGPALFAGFPHLYFAAHPVLAERFVAAAAAFGCGTAQASETPEGGRA